MKIGTKMDYNEPRRGTRPRGFFFDPSKIELVEIDREGVDEETGEEEGKIIPNTEPEPDDPDAEMQSA